MPRVVTTQRAMPALGNNISRSFTPASITVTRALATPRTPLARAGPHGTNAAASGCALTTR